MVEVLVENNIGVGFEAVGGTADLTDVTLRGTSQGLAPIESYNGIFSGGAQVVSLRLGASAGDTFGLMHSEASANHVDLTAEQNGFAGIWVQRSPAFSLSGSRGLLADNGFAGVAVVDTEGARIRDIEVRGVVEGIQLLGIETIRAADGIHLLAADAAIANVTLADNARAGLAVDLGGASTDRLTIDSVTVTGAGNALGAVAQNGVILPGWDQAITRMGPVIGNDAAFAGGLDIAGAVGPSCLPDPSMIIASGAASLIGP
jgi:hypothetical protein